MLVVIDTNVFLSGIFWSGTPSKILDLWIDDKFELIVSKEILNEYFRVLKSFAHQKGKSDIVDQWITFIAQHAHIIEIKQNFDLSTDKDDNKFIDCAVSGNAKYIVSGDKHLKSLKHVLNIEILSPEKFLKTL